MNYFITGGGCIVENSTFGLNRKTAFLKRLSQETGVHIVAGTGIDLFVASKSRNSLTDSIFETGAYGVQSKSQNEWHQQQNLLGSLLLGCDHWVL